jgi:tetratricopeptide (TPR) repeat protein
MLHPIKPGVTAHLPVRPFGKNNLSLTITLFILLTSTIPAYAQSNTPETLLRAQRLAGTNGAIAGQEADVRALESGKPLERTLAGGESQSYRLALAAGQFCHIVVDQRGIDVVVALYGPDGGMIIEVDSPNDLNGPEPVSLLAEAAGAYRLEVRSREKNAAAGRYEVRIEELRAATPQDKSRVAAQKASADAKSLRNQRTAESLRGAIDKYQESLSVWRNLDDRRMMAYSLNEVGLIYGDLGEYQKALDAYAQARALYEMINDPRGRAGMLSNIGWVYSTLGEYQKAIDFHEQALAATRALGDPYNPLQLSNIGANYAALGKYPKALDIHLQVLSIRRARNDLGGQAITLNNIANCYEHLGEKQKALDYYGQALALMPNLANGFYTATTLNHIGVLYRDLGEPQKSLDYFGQALQLRRAIGDRNGEAATLSQIARLERDRGDLVEARNRIEAALAAVESLRTNVASQELRAAFFASVRQYHEFYVDLLMRLHQQRPAEGFAAALQASERARARSLLELLAEARAEIRQGVDPALLEREHALRLSISDKAERQTRLLSGKHTEEQATAMAKEVDALTTEYEEAQAQIRQTSPRYSELTRPLPLTLAEIQQQVLDDETLLLEYSLGEDGSFLWAVTPTSVRGFALPRRAEVEAAARRFLETLTARSQPRQNETPWQRTRRLAEADAEYPKISAALSRMLLGPAAAELGKKRLLIVGEGVLQYIPFAALPEPLPKAADMNKGVEKSNAAKPPALPGAPPLVVEHEVISLPSASVLAALRREAVGRKPADKLVAVLADPVFDSGDPRVALPGRSRTTPVAETAPADNVRRAADESGLHDLVRLRFSRQEADRIASLVPDKMRLKALDFAASRALATSAEIAQYRIVHFATHTLIDNKHPELSGVVLSLVDEQGRPQNGFLRLYDIYNLSLRADLVVLSACQTALGKEVRGEGLVGLTRGFMYAGTPRVVASLWRIDDRAAAEFMGQFYEALLGQGLRPAAALRAAQVAMWTGKRWQAPHYWAAFTLQGEWK